MAAGVFIGFGVGCCVWDGAGVSSVDLCCCVVGAICVLTIGPFVLILDGGSLSTNAFCC